MTDKKLVKMSDKEYKKVLLDMLSYIDKVCTENNINYSMIAGSLIGTIRHKGFIPWDDDIDIGLLPGDYTKLLEALRKGDGRYRLLDYVSTDNYEYPYAKLIDTTTHIKELNKHESYDYGAFIDIFMYSCVPDNKILRNLYLLKYKYKFRIIAGFDTSKKDENILKKIRTCYSKSLNYNKYLKKFDKFARKYNNTKNIVINWPVYGVKKGTILSKYMQNFKQVPFENINVMITEDYDEMLKVTYGDYMTPTPKEKQVGNHDIVAYKIEE